jgi:hypothetical protein
MPVRMFDVVRRGAVPPADGEPQHFGKGESRSLPNASEPRVSSCRACGRRSRSVEHFEPCRPR